MEERKPQEMPDSVSDSGLAAGGAGQSGTLSMAPVNPNISAQARSLLEDLYELRGKGIITGQHEYLETPYTYCEQLKNLTGVYPALKGVEFGAINGQTANQVAAQRQNVVNACLAWHADGGIVAASFHAVYPGRPNWWEHVKFYCTQAQFDAVITPGTTEYNNLLNDIDEVAEYLKQLRDAGVPVLWRPYHEMNGDWFWWGRKNNFAALWEIMFDRYVNHHGLNNLLWVWSANASNQWSDSAGNYYVGQTRTDALGMDIYNADYNQDYYMELLDIGQGKLIAITENGQLPNMTNVRTRQPNYSWFMSWGKMVRSHNSDATINRVFGDPYALTRGEEYDPGQTYPPDTTTGDGLLGKYYVGKAFNTLRVTKVIPVVDFNWKKNTTVGSYEMSARWTGFIRPRYTEEYTLYTNASDGVRLYIGGQLVIDDWTVHSTTERLVSMPLEAGKYYYMTLEYFNNGDPEDAVVQLSWSSESQPKEVIPQSRLYSK